MVTHDNIHIPKASWPHWTWYAIEFFLTLAIAVVVAFKSTDAIEGLSPELQNWVFYGIVALVFFVWYIIIRGLILKKPILGNRS